MHANFAEQEVIFRQGEPGEPLLPDQAGSVFITFADTGAQSDHDSNDWELAMRWAGHGCSSLTRGISTLGRTSRRERSISMQPSFANSAKKIRSWATNS